MKQHALSAIFSALSSDELKALATDIKANGLKSAITVYKGEVLDGWHRYLACQMVKVRPITVDYKGKDPKAFVKSANWHRRHLSASQRALAEVQLSEWAPSGDQRKGGGDPGSPPPTTVAEMAKAAGTTDRTVQRAKVVEEFGSEELKESVKSGKVSVKKAAEEARPSKTSKPKKEAPPDETTLEEWCEEARHTMERDRDELNSLRALVEDLKKDDQKKETAKWRDRFERLEGRLQGAVTEKNEAVKQATYSSGLLAKIRKALKVEKNVAILPAIQELK